MNRPLICMFLSVPLFATAQQTGEPFDFPAIVDNFIPEHDLDQETHYENLLQLLANPVDLNTATPEQLGQLFMLTHTQIAGIIEHRETCGSFLSKYELQASLQFDATTYKQISPFLTVSTGKGRKSWQQQVKEANTYVLLRWDRTLEQQAGYGHGGNRIYLGSPDRMYMRTRSHLPGRFSLGVTAEKDPGEPLEWSAHTKGFDFLSAHLQRQNVGRIRNLILGDFNVRFGQGLVLGNAFGMGKNSQTVTGIRRSNLGFMPYTSRGESGFFRGVATSVDVHRHIRVHAMLSYRNLDGTRSLIDGKTAITSIYTAGLHRTQAERDKKHVATGQNAACVVQWKNGLFDAGLIAQFSRYSLPIAPTPSKYNQYAFSGANNHHVGGYVNLTYKNLNLFGEYAHNAGRGHALIAGALVGLAPSLDLGLHVRHYGKAYQAFYSQAIAENTKPQNETGMYWAITYRIHNRLTLTGYLDIFQFHWLRHNNYAPSDGHEWLVRLHYKAPGRSNFYLQTRKESKMQNSPTANDQRYNQSAIQKYHFLLKADYPASASLRFKTLIQGTMHLPGQPQRGILVAHDIRWKYRKYTITARMALFHTDGFGTRLYSAEPDAWLSFSFPSYHGKGMRIVTLVACKIARKVTLWGRWAQTYLTNQNTIGSTGASIHSNARNDIKLQAIIKF